MPVSRRLILQSAALGATSLALPRFAQAQPGTPLKLSSFLPQDHIVTKQVLLPFAEEVTQGTKWEVSVQIFSLGELANSVGEQLQLMDLGVVDLALVVPAIDPGRFPEMSFVSLPDLIPNVTIGSILLTEMYFEKSRALSFDLGESVPIGYFVTPPYFLHASREINTLDDIRGLKVRSHSAEVSAILRRLEAEPIELPSSKVIAAAQAGELDGAALSWDQYRALNGYSAFQFSVDINLGGASAVLLIMQRSRLSSLPLYQQEVLLNAGGRPLAEKWGAAYDREASRVVSEHKISSLDAESAARWAEMAEVAQQEWVKAGSFEREGALRRAEELLPTIRPGAAAE